MLRHGSRAAHQPADGARAADQAHSGRRGPADLGAQGRGGAEGDRQVERPLGPAGEDGDRQRIGVAVAGSHIGVAGRQRREGAAVQGDGGLVAVSARGARDGGGTERAAQTGFDAGGHDAGAAGDRDAGDAEVGEQCPDGGRERGGPAVHEHHGAALCARSRTGRERVGIAAAGGDVCRGGTCRAEGGPGERRRRGVAVGPADALDRRDRPGGRDHLLAEGALLTHHHDALGRQALELGRDRGGQPVCLGEQHRRSAGHRSRTGAEAVGVGLAGDEVDRACRAGLRKGLARHRDRRRVAVGSADSVSGRGGLGGRSRGHGGRHGQGRGHEPPADRRPTKHGPSLSDRHAGTALHTGNIQPALTD